jgi:hypothetical protein
MSTTLMNPSEILIAGLDLLGPEGQHWTQGAYQSFNSDGICFCSLGAIRQAAFGRTYFISSIEYQQYRDAKKTLESLTTYGAVADWQDDRSRTFPEVKEVFLIAIKMAQEAEQLGAA